jgi:hypothetical protein
MSKSKTQVSSDSSKSPKPYDTIFIYRGLLHFAQVVPGNFIHSNKEKEETTK